MADFDSCLHADGFIKSGQMASVKKKKKTLQSLWEHFHGEW